MEGRTSMQGRGPPPGGWTAVLAAVLLCCPLDLQAAHWARLYAIGDSTRIQQIVPTAGCGLAAAGMSWDQDDPNVWVLKLDARGEVEWARSYGGPEDENTVSIDQAAGGGYWVAATTRSFGAGWTDLWVLRLDASGDVVWQKTYGDTRADGTPLLHATPDGGVLLVGSTTIEGRNADVWILKLDASGGVAWQKAYGGPGPDDAVSFQATADGGMVIAGLTGSFGAGGFDIWVLKLDGAGAVEWEKAYGEADSEWANGILQTSDGGYMVVGRRQVDPNPGFYCQILKLDARGEIEWEREVRGGGYDEAWEVVELTGGGYVVTAFRSSFSPQVGWLFQLDGAGNLEWENTYGGAEFDDLLDVLATPWGGFLAVGGSNTFSGGEYDAWILKLNAEGRVNSTCDFIQEARSTISATSLAVEETACTMVDTAVVGVDTNATVRDTPVTVTEQCADGGCLEMRCGSARAEPDPVCEGTLQTLTAGGLCGEGPVTVDWDLDGDTLPDAAGNPLEVALPAGTWRVRATATDSCPDPGPQSCFVETEVEVLPAAPPGEVSAVRAGEPPLRVNRAATRLLIEQDTEATAYNVYADRIGSWYAPGPATGSACGITDWTDNGDGTITLDYAVPANSWVVVTASTPCAEGPAGCGTAPTERTTLGTWEMCGPAP